MTQNIDFSRIRAIFEIIGSLFLYSNSFVDDKFFRTLIGMDTLQSIDLSFNNFGGTIPNEIGSWTGVENIIFEGTNLSGTIPTEISNLTKLKSFIISSSELTGTIPKNLLNLTNLSE